MAIKTRLDALVKLRERDEDQTRLKLAEAARATRTSEDRLAQARTQASRDERKSAMAFEWDVVELAHHRALSEVKKAEEHVAVATTAQESARQHHATARGKAEAVRRVAEVRREEIRKDRADTERRSVDDLTSMMFVHRGKEKSESEG